MGKRQIFAGNWKMFKTFNEAVELVKGLATGLKKVEGREYVLFPPSVYLREVSSLCSDTSFVTGAQNMYHESQGAFTGEISPAMVRDCGAGFILIGHSERRHIFHETDEDVNRKVKAALIYGIQPMICIGELLEERESGQTADVLIRQIRGAFSGIEKADIPIISMAYEPVWAIGTGKVATPETAQDAHMIIRGIMRDIYDDELAASMPVLYGGSVKPDNIEGLYRMPDIDGVLVGGASLEIKTFLDIINLNFQKTIS